MGFSLAGRQRPLIAAVATFLAFITAGSVPLLPLIVKAPDAAAVATVGTGFVFCIGSIESYSSMRTWSRSAKLETFRYRHGSGAASASFRRCAGGRIRARAMSEPDLGSRNLEVSTRDRLPLAGTLGARQQTETARDRADRFGHGCAARLYAVAAYLAERGSAAHVEYRGVGDHGRHRWADFRRACATGPRSIYGQESSIMRRGSSPATPFSMSAIRPSNRRSGCCRTISASTCALRRGADSLWRLFPFPELPIYR